MPNWINIRTISLSVLLLTGLTISAYMAKARPVEDPFAETFRLMFVENWRSGLRRGQTLSEPLHVTSFPDVDWGKHSMRLVSMAPLADSYETDELEITCDQMTVSAAETYSDVGENWSKVLQLAQQEIEHSRYFPDKARPVYIRHCATAVRPASESIDLLPQCADSIQRRFRGVDPLTLHNRYVEHSRILAIDPVNGEAFMPLGASCTQLLHPSGVTRLNAWYLVINT